jgi:hypothetical protein
MSLIDSASLIVTPNGYKEGTLYSVIPSDGSGDMSVVRATTATRVNSAGLVELVPYNLLTYSEQFDNAAWVKSDSTITANSIDAPNGTLTADKFIPSNASINNLLAQNVALNTNIPRLDYSNGTCPSLLVEPQRTNLNAYSEDISQTQYNKVRCTVSANSVVSPSGYTNADKIIQDSANTSWGGVSQVYSPTAPATLSVFAKKIDNDYIAVIGHSVNPTAAWFNLADGTVGTTEVNVTSASIVDYGNGWYRCSITATTVNRFTVLHASSNGGNTAPVNSETALWGFQLEASSSYPTSYIPTTSASVTRNADVISKTGISSLIGQTEGTIFFEGVIYGENSSVNRRILSISNGTTANAINIQTPAINSKLEFEVTNGGATQVFISAANNSLVYGQNFKAAFAYKNNDFVAYINGVQIGTDTNGTVPTCDKLSFDRGNNTSNFEGSAKAAALWKTRLTNDELERLTGTGFNTYAEMANYYNYITQ